MQHSNHQTVTRLAVALLCCAGVGCQEAPKGAGSTAKSAPRSSATALSAAESTAPAAAVPPTATDSNAVVAAAATAGAASTAGAESDRFALRRWRFAEVAPGGMPRGFVAETGAWSMITDETAPKRGSQVLAQTAASDDAIFNLLLVDGTQWLDVEISVRLRAVSGRVDQGGGVIWRARDTKNYYVARYNPLEDNYRVYFVRDGRRAMLQGKTLQVDHRGWHTVRVTMKGDRIRCYLDDELHLEAQDRNFMEAGRIGLWTKADAETHFDDLRAGRLAETGE